MPGCSSGSPSDLECRQIAELLGDYLDGSLPRETREMIDFHIDGCAPCVAFLNTYRGTVDAARKLPEIGVPAELKKRLLTVLRSSTPPPSRSPST
jgi:anti-sigma factor RsiW